MWLPASFFNRAIHFDSTSKFGRKRKHTVDPENAMEGNKRAKRRASYKRATDAAGSEKKEKQTNGKQFKHRKHTKENGEGRPSASKSSVTERNAREVSSETDGDVVEGTTNGTRLRVSKTKVSSGSSSAQPKQALSSGNRNVPQAKGSKKRKQGKIVSFLQSSSKTQSLYHLDGFCRQGKGHRRRETSHPLICICS